MAQPEKLEQQQIKQYLQGLGAKVYVLGTRRRRSDHQGTMQTGGLPDLIAFLHQRTYQGAVAVQAPGARVALFIECKAKGGRMSDDQKELRALCQAAGVPHVVGGLDDVIAWLVEHNYVRAYQVPWYRRHQEVV